LDPRMREDDRWGARMTGWGDWIPACARMTGGVRG